MDQNKIAKSHKNFGQSISMQNLASDIFIVFEFWCFFFINQGQKKEKIALPCAFWISHHKMLFLMQKKSQLQNKNATWTIFHGLKIPKKLDPDC
jgi:hypothetical protein